MLRSILSLFTNNEPEPFPWYRISKQTPLVETTNETGEVVILEFMDI